MASVQIRHPLTRFRKIKWIYFWISSPNKYRKTWMLLVLLPSDLCRLQPPLTVAPVSPSAVTYVASRWVTTVHVTTSTWRPPLDVVLSVATPPFHAAFTSDGQSAVLVIVTDVAPRRRPSAASCWSRVFVVLGEDLLTWSGDDLVVVSKDQRGRTVRVSTFHWPPYVGTATPQTALTHGLEVQILKTLSERLHFKTQVTVYAKASWASLLRDTETGDAELAFSGWGHFGDWSSVDAVLTMPYMRASLTWYVSSGGPVARWRTLLLPFTTPLWLLVLLSAAGVALTAWLLQRPRSRSSASLAALHAWATMLGVGVTPGPRRAAPRLLLALHLVASLQLYTVYQAEVVALFRNPPLDAGVVSLDDAEAAGLTLGASNFMREALTDAERNRFRGRHVLCDDMDPCLRRAALDGDVALLCTSTYADYAVAANFTTPGGRPRVRRLHGDDAGASAVMSYDIVALVSRHSALLPHVDDAVGGMLAAGLVAKWWRDLTTATATAASVDDHPPLGKLTLHHLEPAFAVLFVGIIVAGAIFLAEFLQGRRRVMSSNIL